MFDIFISYRSKYYNWVKHLYINLTACGFRVFLDQDEMRTGRKLDETLINAISNSQHFILIATPDIVESEWVERESSYFTKLMDNDPELFYHPIVFNDPTNGMKLMFPMLDSTIYRKISSSDRDQYREMFKSLFNAIKGIPQNSNDEINEDNRWLHIPEDNYFPLDGGTEVLHDDSSLKEKAALTRYLRLLSEHDINDYEPEEVHDFYDKLTEFVDSHDYYVQKLSIILLCVLHHNYIDFRKDRVRGNMIRDKMASYAITDSDRERLFSLTNSRVGFVRCGLNIE